MGFNQTVFTLIKPVGGLKAAKFLSRKHPKILMYHRVSSNGSNGSISVDSFRAQMRVVKQHFKPLTLKRLLDANNCGNIPDNAVVITVDDGYKDFADYIWPIMQEEGVPATIFITTGFVNRELWLWPDKIKYMLKNTDRKSASIPGFGKVPIIGDELCAWNIISDYCLKIRNHKKNEIIESLFHDLGVEYQEVAPKGFEAVSWDQLREMVSLGLDVGSHSHSHPILTSLTKAELYQELVKPRRLIFDNLGFKPDSFCYPNGTRTDFNEAVKEFVVKAGYRYAVAAFPAPTPLDDLLEIKRYAGTNRQATFEKNLFGLSYIWSLLRGHNTNE